MRCARRSREAAAWRIWTAAPGASSNIWSTGSGKLARPAPTPLRTRGLPLPTPRILTTTVGSYPVPDWLPALPSEQARLDATRLVFDIQRQAGIDLPTDGELYRFDVNHPDTNGMIDYFVGRFSGVSTEVGASSW